MDNRADFFQKKMSNPRSFSRQKKTSKLWIWLFIVLLLLVIWLVALKIFYGDDIGWDEAQDSSFSLWEEVSLQWNIKADGGITPYIIDDINYWKIWLNSSSNSVKLSDYVWFVQLTWIVEKFYKNYPVVKVYSISWNKVGVGDEISLVFESDGSFYLPEAGILFLPNFYDEYLFLNDWKNWKILIKKIDSWEEITINYFRCNSVDPSKNCKWLVNSFESNHAQSFSNYEGDIYYRQSETQWFVANGDWWGIYITDISEDELHNLKDLIKFANEKNISEWVKIRAANICQWSWEKLQNVDDSEVLLKQEWLVVTVSGEWMNKKITCQILVDFSLPAKWQLKTLTIWDDVVVSSETWANEEVEVEETWNVVEASISANSLDIDVPQFPVKEEWLEYKSQRWWYILKFPSSNISYSVSSVKENFGRSDVNCSYVINVIKYADKENLEVSPAIRVYECLWTVNQSWNPGIVVYSILDKKFVVQMNDGAWNDFSTHLKFEALVGE